MTTVTIDVDVDVDISDHLDECTTSELAEALSEKPRTEAMAALQAVGLLSVTDENPEMNDLENMIAAFNSGDRDLFEISLRNLFPIAKEQIAFAMCHKQLSLAA